VFEVGWESWEKAYAKLKVKKENTSRMTKDRLSTEGDFVILERC
jgi:hypothetical protein